MNNNTHLVITEESINKANFIRSNMEGSTFHTHFHILYDICNSLNKDDVTYFEIGTFAGASAALMSMHPKVKKCYSVDIGYPMSEDVAIRNVNKFKHNECTYQYIRGSSYSKDIVDRVHQIIQDVDILFIDGDHDYQPVLDDFRNYNDLVLPGGYIVFDDYLDTGCPQVRRAVDYIVSNELGSSYEVIGSLTYNLLERTTNSKLGGSNEFILKKII